MNVESDTTLLKILKYVQETYRCHTIILYGSHARNQANATSDYDMVAIRKTGEDERDCRVFDNVYLDLFVYSEKSVDTPGPFLIRIKDGIVLIQKDEMGARLLKRIKNMLLDGPKKISPSEKEVIMVWHQKMLNRVKSKDLEGNFRQHWLLFDLLESYFLLRDHWYFGPKESFQWLKENDLITYQAFEEALKPDANYFSIKKLVDAVAV